MSRAGLSTEIDAVTLGCPKCPRRLISRKRRRTTYRRITPWAGTIARFRCQDCGYVHAFTKEWLLDLPAPWRMSSPPETSAR